MKNKSKDIKTDLDISPEVAAALSEGHPLVALESSLIAHGLPRPHNLEVVMEMQSEVRAEGAVPATVAILGGRIKVGLSDIKLEDLSISDEVLKVSRRDFASVVTRRLTAGTTVSGTMLAAHWAGIRVLATGGIGGVHRGDTHDVSADLTELSNISMVVVCSGPKAILDLVGTMEWLETHGVPVIGYGTDQLPAFYSQDSGLDVEVRADTPEEVADLVAAHRKLELTGSTLVVVPVPPDADVQKVEIESAIDRALSRAEVEGVVGKALTPFLLEQLVLLTGGSSLNANIALLVNNARVAAQISVALSLEPMRI